MDIFIHRDYDDFFAEYLKKKEGYQNSGAWMPQSSASYRAEYVHVYEKGSGHATTRIHLLQTVETPILAVLRGYYLTTSMNFITHNRAVSIFPWETFVLRKLYFLNQPDAHFGEAFAKYDQLGWTSERFLDSHIDREKFHAMYSSRWVDGERCWMIDVMPEVHGDGFMPDSLLACHNFEVDAPDPGERAAGSMQDLRIKCEPLIHPTLRYQYACSDPDWAKSVMPKLDWLGGLQFMRCARHERPRHALDVIQPTAPHHCITFAPRSKQETLLPFQVPKWWKHIDERLREFSVKCIHKSLAEQKEKEPKAKTQ